MRIAFFSGSDFTLPLLEQLVQEHDVFVITKPTPILRGKLLVSQLVRFAESKGLTIYQPASFKSLTLASLPSELASCSLAIVASYGKILPQWLLDLFPKGAINWHPSALPLLRGPTPVQTAIAKGDEVTALTWIKMSSEMDAGDILLQNTVTIDPTETTPQLLKRMVTIGSETLPQVIASLENPNFTSVLQDHTKATFTQMLTKDDAFVDPNQISATELFNHFRAYIEFPKTCIHDPHYGVIKLTLCSRPIPTFNPDNRQGVFVQSNTTPETCITCKEGFVPVQEILLENGKRLDFRGVRF